MIENSPVRMVREHKTIEAMALMYCSAHHKTNTNICHECAGILNYAKLRLDRCPFGEKKMACAKCAIHCYSPLMRAKIIEIMKFAGKRMILKHPMLALLHGMDSVKTRHKTE